MSKGCQCPFNPGQDPQFSAMLVPPLVALALPFDLDERKEKRLMRRREKLPDFFRTLEELGDAESLPRLDTSSWDWLKLGSFCLFLRRNKSLVPLRRNPTAIEGADAQHKVAFTCITEVQNCEFY